MSNAPASSPCSTAFSSIVTVSLDATRAAAPTAAYWWSSKACALTDQDISSQSKHTQSVAHFSQKSTTSNAERTLESTCASSKLPSKKHLTLRAQHPPSLA